MKQRIQNKKPTLNQYLKIIDRRFETCRKRGLESPTQGFFITGKIRRFERLLKKHGYNFKTKEIFKGKFAVKVCNRNIDKALIVFKKMEVLR